MEWNHAYFSFPAQNFVFPGINDWTSRLYICFIFYIHITILKNKQLANCLKQPLKTFNTLGILSVLTHWRSFSQSFLTCCMYPKLVASYAQCPAVILGFPFWVNIEFASLSCLSSCITYIVSLSGLFHQCRTFSSNFLFKKSPWRETNAFIFPWHLAYSWAG